MLDWETQMMFIFVLLLSLAKLYFFLRLFKPMTYIVTMISKVQSDLKTFLVVYLVSVFMIG